jgi:hypothetical protein
MISASELIGVEEIEDCFLRSAGDEVAIAPAEVDGAGCAEVEIALVEVGPVRRQEIIGETQIA